MPMSAESHTPRKDVIAVPISSRMMSKPQSSTGTLSRVGSLVPPNDAESVEALERALETVAGVSPEKVGEQPVTARSKAHLLPTEERQVKMAEMQNRTPE